MSPAEVMDRPSAKTPEIAVSPERAPNSKSAIGTPASTFDWGGMRNAFITRPERPTYGELGTEFHCSEQRVQKQASDEGWSALRAAYFDQRLRDSDATVALLKAVKMDTAIVHGFADVAVDALATIRAIVQDAKLATKAASTRANTINTAMFAFSNLANACARVGIVGLPKSLKDAAQGSNGQWSPQMLSNLNVTVQNIVNGRPAADHAMAVAISTDPSNDDRQGTVPETTPTGGAIQRDLATGRFTPAVEPAQPGSGAPAAPADAAATPPTPPGTPGSVIP